MSPARAPLKSAISIRHINRRMPKLDELKARVSPQDTVHFESGGRCMHGRVIKLGAKRAGVMTPSGDYYYVPYALIQPQTTSKNHFRWEQDALETCRVLLQQHGLRDWSACLDDATHRAGACDYRKRQISLSRLCVRAASIAEIRDTILHEIAHALAGFAHHHDAVWKKIASDIGCSGERCHNINFGVKQTRWIAQCPNGCFSTPRERRNRGRICKKCRQPIRFIPWADGLVSS